MLDLDHSLVMTEITRTIIEGTDEEQANYIFQEIDKRLQNALNSVKIISADFNLAAHAAGGNIMLNENTKPE